MILRRIGRKSGMTAKKIIALFPPIHTYDVYYDMFFGAGGMFFSKPMSKYNWVNDLDGEVYNFWQVIARQKEEFIEQFAFLPLHEEIFKWWMDNRETEPVMKAIRFIMLSNFSLYGKMNCFLTEHNVITKRDMIIKQIDIVSERLQRCVFRNKDFRDFIKDIYISDNHIPVKKRFIYADPPYVASTNNYNTPEWTLSDTIELLDILVATKIRFAMSEYSNELVIAEAKKRNLFFTDVGDTRAITSTEKKSDILITNYPLPKRLFRQTTLEDMLNTQSSNQ